MLQTIGHQLQETQQAANEEVTLQYRQWLQEGYQKGLEGLFRSLKSSELAWERPYRMTPMPQRMDQRLADWGGNTSSMLIMEYQPDVHRHLCLPRLC